MSGEIARSRAAALTSKVTVADLADASSVSCEVALPGAVPMSVAAVATALVAAKAESSCSHECRREPTVPTTYLGAQFFCVTYLQRPQLIGRDKCHRVTHFTGDTFHFR